MQHRSTKLVATVGAFPAVGSCPFERTHGQKGADRGYLTFSTVHLLRSLARHEFEHGEGVALPEPLGDLVENVLP